MRRGILFSAIAVLVLISCIGSAAAYQVEASDTGQAFDLFSLLISVLSTDLPDFVERMAAIVDHPGDYEAIMQDYEGMGGSAGHMFDIWYSVNSVIMDLELVPPSVREQYARAEERFGDLGSLLDGLLHPADVS